MKPTSWMRFATVLLSLCVLAAGADTPLPADRTTANTMAPEATYESSNGTPSEVYVELRPLVVRGRRIESPRGASMRLWVVSGRTADRLERGILRESPRAMALRSRREAGETPDRLYRGIPDRSARAEVSFPTPGLAR